VENKKALHREELFYFLDQAPKKWASTAAQRV
jgi:hypothetical protein